MEVLNNYTLSAFALQVVMLPMYASCIILVNITAKDEISDLPRSFFNLSMKFVQCKGKKQPANQKKTK